MDKADDWTDSDGAVYCGICGESWDTDTQGYEAARETLEWTVGDGCPACYGDLS